MYALKPRKEGIVDWTDPINYKIRYAHRNHLIFFIIFKDTIFEGDTIIGAFYVGLCTQTISIP